MPSIINATTTNGVAISPDNSGSLQLATNNGTTAVTIDTSQNVGIGTSSPSSFAATTNLALGTGSSGAAVTVFTGTAQTGAVYFADGTSGADRYRGAIEYTHSNNALLLSTDGTERMRIDSSGNVGIGITTPQQTLHVNNSSSPRIKLTNATTGTGASDGSEISIFDADNSLRIINRESANILFGTADTERMRITSGGNLLVGTTTARNSGIVSVDYNGNAAGGMGLNDTASANGSAYIGFLTGGTFRGSITNNNNTAVAYNTTSDYRLKENIAPMTGALATVAQLKPVTYKWKSDGSDGQGFIAHELAEVCPDAVTGEKDAVDSEGNPRYQGVDTSFLVATLTAAIQELKAELDMVKAELNTLKNPPVEGTE